MMEDVDTDDIVKGVAGEWQAVRIGADINAIVSADIRHHVDIAVRS